MKNTRKSVVIACLTLVLVLVLLISGLRFMEPTYFDNKEETAAPSSVPSKTVTKDNVGYFPRQDITTFLIMGIDEKGPVADSGHHRNNGESDVVMLAIFDEKDQTYTVLALNRDTMVDMPALGIGGKRVGTYYGQLALSHTYGNGIESSCENTRETVSNLLKGAVIDYYVSLNMDAINIVNDAVGGVKVNVVDDFSSIDETIPMGEVVLNSEQAYNYVRARKEIGDELNISRMRRQKEYINGLIEALKAKMEDSDSFIMNTYTKISPYLVTDCSVNTLSSLFNRFKDYTLKEIVTPEGENVLADRFYEFYLDKEKIEELTLRLFYAEKQ